MVWILKGSTQVAIHKLKPMQVEKAKIKGMMNDGGGLYLNVRATGTKSWVFRYKRQNKTVDMGLGPYPTVTLKQARIESEKWRKVNNEGIDPKIERDRQRDEIKKAENEEILNFSACAEQFISDHKAEWTNKKHIQQWENTLKTYAYPVMGNTPVDKIDVSMVLNVIKPIWSTKNETATRVRQRIENILDWATVHGYRSSDNPARWRGHLDKLLPKPSKIKVVKHHAALPYQEIGGLITTLRAQASIRAKALEFTILTGVRTKEVIGAKWSEMDLENKVWTVPACRMKMKKEHRVPLSSGAVKVLEQLPVFVDTPYLFVGTRVKQHLSNMSMLTLLQRPEHESGLGYDSVTVHGFRSTFRDWAAEQTSFPREVCERALAHDVRSAVESAYQRGDLLEKRRELMDAWDLFVNSLPE